MLKGSKAALFATGSEAVRLEPVPAWQLKVAAEIDRVFGYTEFPVMLKLHTKLSHKATSTMSCKALRYNIRAIILLCMMWLLIDG